MNVVPEGYKQTEVGVIPEDWEVQKLGDIFYIKAAGDLDKGAFSVHKSDVCAFPIFANSVSNKGLYGYSVRNTYPPNSVTVTARGELGHAFYRDEPYSAIGRLLTLVPCTDLDSRFFSEYINLAISIVSESTGVPQLTAPQFEKYSVPLPPLPEQRAIAEALADADALIAAQERLIVKKQAVKQGAMQELLTGRRRLEGWEGEWEEVRLGDVATFLNNGTNSRAELTSEGVVKYLHYGDIHKSTSAFFNACGKDVPYLPSDKAARLDRLRDGDLVIADASEDSEGVGKAVEIFNASGQEIVSGLHTIAVRFDTAKIAKGFAGYLQFFPGFKTHMHRLAAGTKVLAISAKFVASAVLSLPPPSEQEAIASILSDMDSEIAGLERELGKLRTLKQGMMQELLTGRVRLVEPQKGEK